MEKKDYSDIIDLPHHESKKHARMTALERAGQFAPFAALVGYDEEVERTAELAAVKNESILTREKSDESC